MSEISSNNKRIAKNTLLLYIRMLFIMAVNLYISRVILNALGVEDFGIYNVVGGVVSMLTIITGSLSSAISRFLTFELGKEDLEKLRKIFSTSVNILFGLSFFIIIVIEILGIWFLNNKLQIPSNRLYAANWVMQFSLLTFCINLISVPYNAVIIAHEKMSVFAYISIIEALLKLSTAFYIIICPIDKLIAYALLLAITSVIIRLIYGFYSKRNFEECSYTLKIDKALTKQIASFSGWYFIGNSAGVLRTQGINILLNIYGGPAINAARGIAVQVNNAIAAFGENFITAVRPQITKLYAQNNVTDSYNLVLNSARLSFFLLLILSMPIIIETDYIITLWLKNVPSYVILFIRLTLILTLIESLSHPFITMQLATGNIRNYQLVVGCMHLMNFPVSWYFLAHAASPYVVYYIAITLAVICLYLRLYMLNRIVKIDIYRFLKEVIIKIFSVIIISFLIIVMGKHYLYTNEFISVISTMAITTLSCIMFGLKRGEIYQIRNILLK